MICGMGNIGPPFDPPPYCPQKGSNIVVCLKMSDSIKVLARNFLSVQICSLWEVTLIEMGNFLSFLTSRVPQERSKFFICPK